MSQNSTENASQGSQRTPEEILGNPFADRLQELDGSDGDETTEELKSDGGNSSVQRGVESDYETEDDGEDVTDEEEKKRRRLLNAINEATRKLEKTDKSSETDD